MIARETCSDRIKVSSSFCHQPSEDTTITPPPISRPLLRFRPWTAWARTVLYEYFSMSWAARTAAEHAKHPPLEARLVGESFELAFKVLNILSRGPGRDLKVGHNLGALISDTPPLDSLLRKLWGRDLDHVLDILDGECNPSQVRYGAAGGSSDKRNRIIPSGYAERPGVWTSTTLTLYEELMSSLGQAIWSNYPKATGTATPSCAKSSCAPRRLRQGESHR